MHPMFVKLYLEPEADDERGKRRRPSRPRRLQTRTAVRTPVRDRGPAPRR